MNDTITIPPAQEMVEAGEKSRARRKKREQEVYPARLIQWRKCIADQLQGAKTTEVQAISVSPPPGKEDWDFYLRRVLDAQAREQLMKELRVLGYSVTEDQPADLNSVKLVISWR